MLSACLFVLLTPGLDTADGPWPQWRGPNRDAVSSESGLLKAWPEGGPKLLWTFKDAGFGYSDVAVVGADLYLLGKYPGMGEAIVRVDAKTGTLVQRQKLDDGANKYSTGWGGGPRGTPTVEGKLAWALSSDGVLACYDRMSLEQKWSVNLREKYGSKTPTWGYAESPLIDGDKVVVTPGGSACVVAFHKETGKEIWKSAGTGEQQQYSSLVPMKLGGARMYVTQGAKNVFAVYADDGKLAWSFGEIARRTAVIPTPVVSGKRVFVTAGYGAGCECVDIEKNGDGFVAKKAFANTNLGNHHGGVIQLDGHVYGHSERGGWTCLSLETGEVVWKHQARGAGKGSIGHADGRFYCFEENLGGACILIEASKEGWKEHGRLKLPANSGLDRKAGKVWSHPVIAGGKLYLRDLDLLYCYDVSAK